jgi:hypothetical protein
VSVNPSTTANSLPTKRCCPHRCSCVVQATKTNPQLRLTEGEFPATLEEYLARWVGGRLLVGGRVGGWVARCMHVRGRTEAC